MSSVEEEPFSAWAFPPAGLQYSAVFLQQIPSSLGDNPSLLFFSLGIDKCPSPFLLLPMPLRISYRQNGEALRKHHTRCHPNCQIFKALSYHISSFVAKNGKIVFLFPYQFFKYQLVFTNFILVNTNSLFYPSQYKRLLIKIKATKKSPLSKTEILAKRRFIVFETSSQ